MIWRILGGLAGVGVVGTATHLNVMHAGGYQSQDAPLIIAVAILVAFGMGFVSWAFGEGFRGAAVLLGLLLLVGEGYWVLTNADRELVTRKAQTAPIADAQRTRNLAEKRLTDAKKAKADADKAAVDEVASPAERLTVPRCFWRPRIRPMSNSPKRVRLTRQPRFQSRPPRSLPTLASSNGNGTYSSQHCGRA